MRHQWQLPDPVLIGLAPVFKPIETLIEFDGPQLVTLIHEKQKWLALAVDDEFKNGARKAKYQAIRWVLAPISSHEFEGLVNRGFSVRSVFSKENLMVVDYSSHDLSLLGVWHVDRKNIPESAMPESGAPLPTSVRERFAKRKRIKVPFFDIVSNLKYVPFGTVSAVTGRLQALWSAFAGHTAQGHITLGAVAFARGSLRVNVHTDSPLLFAQIAEEYRALAIVSDDAKGLTNALNRKPENVAEAYREYLKAVDLQQAEVLVKWDDAVAFMGHAVARRTRQQMREKVSSETEVKTKEAVTLRGCFDNFWRSRPIRDGTKRQRPARFEFYEVDSGQTYQGGIDRTLKARTESREFQLTIGRRSVLYSVKILIQRTNGEIAKTVLQDFDLIQSPR
jgi:hypothetical protein